MESDLKFRRAGPADAELLADLNGDVHAMHVAAAPDFFRTPTHKEAAAAFQQLLAKDAIVGFIASIGERPVGYLVLEIKALPANAFCHARRWVYLEQIGIAPAWQGRGIGKEFLDITRKFARENNIDAIEVDSWAFNGKAQAFFLGHGFKPRLLKMRM